MTDPLPLRGTTTRAARFMIDARRIAAAALVLAAGGAAAHDTWLAPVAAGPRALRLELATGDRYPLAESAMPRTSIVEATCLDAGGKTSPLRIDEVAARATILSSRTITRGMAASCWAETRPHEVELTDALVDVYFREIRPRPEHVQMWQSQKGNKIVWRERYSKLARVEVTATPEGEIPASLREPNGRGLEILPTGSAPLRMGGPLVFRLTLDGKPLAAQSVELVSERSRIGLWHASDDRGEVQLRLPFNGRWILRAIHLEAPVGPDAPWTSRFGTFLFEAR